MTPSVYSTKRDAWLVVVLWASVITMAVAALVLLFTAGPPFFSRALAGLLAASAGFILWVMHGTRYVLDDATLRVRSGPFRWEVPIESIEEVFPTRNPLSSPAFSLDRLEIRYRDSAFGIMISPLRKEDFLKDLAARAPQLVADGDRLTKL